MEHRAESSNTMVIVGSDICVEIANVILSACPKDNSS